VHGPVSALAADGSLVAVFNDLLHACTCARSYQDFRWKQLQLFSSINMMDSELVYKLKHALTSAAHTHLFTISCTNRIYTYISTNSSIGVNAT